MTHLIRRSLFALLALLTLVPALDAQRARQKTIDPVPPAERKVETDDKGKQQWAKWQGGACPMCRTAKKIACPTCKDLEHAKSCPECGTKKKPMPKQAPCRMCAGVGTLPDPLEKAPCPGCAGASVFPCAGCGGEGNYPVQGGGKKRQKCAVCRGHGALKCGVCKGRRLVESAKLLAKDNLKKLKAARNAAEDALTKVKDWKPLATKARKDVKEFQKMIKSAAKDLAPLKRVSKAMADLVKDVSKMDVYRGAADRKSRSMRMMAQFTAWYLKHQVKILDLAVKRVEHNEAKK